MVYQFRYLLAVVWVSQLAWMCAPAVEAAEDGGLNLSSYRQFSPNSAAINGVGNCGNSWAADDCGMTTNSWSDDERTNHRRIKARDIAQGIMRNFVGDELELLHLKQRANFKPYARQLGISDLSVGFSVTSSGSQLRFHNSADDRIALSLRGAPNNNDANDTVVGANVQFHW